MVIELVWLSLGALTTLPIIYPACKMREFLRGVVAQFGFGLDWSSGLGLGASTFLAWFVYMDFWDTG
jgi:hypothetical protein